MDSSSDDESAARRRPYSSIKSSYPRPSFSRPPVISCSSFGFYSSGRKRNRKPSSMGKDVTCNLHNLPSFCEPDSGNNFASQFPRNSEEDLMYQQRRIKLMAEPQSYAKESQSQTAESDIKEDNGRKNSPETKPNNDSSYSPLERMQDRKVLLKAMEDLNQPRMEADLPKGILSVTLLRHQKIALAWMMEKEKVKGVCDGGFLADDQGLGKTISMIALIQMQRPLQEKHKSVNNKVPITTVRVKTEPLNFEEQDYMCR
ncbi:OLC1v1009371C1 [Oldenlandia corymbosa var. corymbosa]|uniref:OLC1v1009371C1 n=1 Tax=Oldenlandia corymbosa var. corymbosa TaxID=529605 RepID=A0AAV1DNV5_OLDCO|nr:OLC1v1009371C1 [Oldenlandia corymbosa var. corymbosa]